VFGAFSYEVFEDEKKGPENIVIDEELIVQENTVQEKKPPPPPPPPELEIVEDDEEIEEEQAEIETTDTDQDEAFEVYEEEEDVLEDTDEVFEIFDVSEKASFPGGEDGLRRFLHDNVNYPDMALENDIEGTVNLVFTVTKTGKIIDVRIQGAKRGFGLEDEAIRVIRKTSGMWSPAKQRDNKVNMRFRIPVNFKIF